MTTRLDQVTDFPALVEYLREELEWPIAEADFEALTFDYTPEEVGLDSAKVGGGIEIKQLRPLSRKQPWGIFFVNLPKKHLSTTILRTLLGSLAPKKRASNNPAERVVFDQRDLMFIANTGEAGHRHIDFAHFRNPSEGQRTAPLQVLGWDADDTERRMKLTGAMLKEKLHWPELTEDVDTWRERWTEAFREPPRYPIKQSKLLAQEMATLAKRIRNRVAELIAVETDKGALRRLHEGFKEALIHDLTPDKFADYYAQTITYGLFSARVSRPSTGFGHDTIHLNVACTSPFLKEMLSQFLEAGGRKKGSGGDDLDFDALGVGDVIAMLEATDMDSVLADWDHKNQDEDPVVHFYQDFLDLYDPGEKKKRGVFYTPRPVVSFIVRSVDEVLRTEFGLEDGLASTATWGDVIAASKGKEGAEITLPEGEEESDPFVRILDPATGTGTFLVECVDLIHATMVAKWKKAGKRDAEINALWNDYVPRHLLPRLTGFELMMAPYAIAHVKLGLKLADTGYTFGSDARAQIYLTNALEPAQDLDMQLAFMSEALAHEAKAANEAKETRFTVVLGNPPYAGHSGSPSRDLKGRLTPAGKLVQGYLMVDGQPLGEKNPKWLNNDYVKFFSFAEQEILKSGRGVIGLITSHSWLDSSTHRGMRASLQQNLDAIWLIDCHGNLKKRQVAGDEGVFEIEEGTNITVAARSGGTQGIFHHNLFGKAEGPIGKFAWLNEHTAQNGAAELIKPSTPFYLFHQMTGEDQHEYADYVALPDAMPAKALGFQTHRDQFAIAFDDVELSTRMSGFASPNHKLHGDVVAQFDLSDNRDWKIEKARSVLRGRLKTQSDAVDYKPFDLRRSYVGYEIMDYPRTDFIEHVTGRQNLILSVCRQQNKPGFRHVFCGRNAPDSCFVSAGTKEGSYAFTLWRFPKGTETRILPNIAPSFANRVAALTGLAYDDCVEGPKQAALTGIVKPKPEQTAMFAGPRRERGEPGKSFGPRDLFDYIYAVLHSPAYRERYADYLKSDFARIPLPGSRDLFEALVPIGTELVALHLLDADALPALKDPKSIRLAGSGKAQVTMPAARFENDAYEGDRMYIAADKSRWFETVPAEAADFHIGGYQPARKWLKDRAQRGGKKASDGRVLTDDDILHYRRMITALTRTAELMPTVDEVIAKHGGWPDAFKGMRGTKE